MVLIKFSWKRAHSYHVYMSRKIQLLRNDLIWRSGNHQLIWHRSDAFPVVQTIVLWEAPSFTECFGVFDTIRGNEVTGIDIYSNSTVLRQGGGTNMDRVYIKVSQIHQVHLNLSLASVCEIFMYNRALPHYICRKKYTSLSTLPKHSLRIVIYLLCHINCYLLFHTLLLNHISSCFAYRGRGYPSYIWDTIRFLLDGNGNVSSSGIAL